MRRSQAPRIQIPGSVGYHSWFFNGERQPNGSGNCNSLTNEGLVKKQGNKLSVSFYVCHWIRQCLKRGVHVA